MKTVFITGIDGFLGSEIAHALSSKYLVLGLEFSKNSLRRLPKNQFQIFDAFDNLEDIFKTKKIDFLIHTATIYRAENNVGKILETNIMLPVKLMQLAENYGVQVFVNTDSFFNSNTSKYSYLNEYTLSKKHSLEWLKSISKNCRLVNMKIFHMYGNYDSHEKFITKITKKIVEEEDQIELTDGIQKRDFIHLYDVVNAYKVIIQNHKALNPFVEFEVGSGTAKSIKSLVLLIKKLGNSDSKLIFGAIPRRKGEYMLSKANPDKLFQLGWYPEVSIEKGITELIQTFRK